MKPHQSRGQGALGRGRRKSQESCICLALCFYPGVRQKRARCRVDATFARRHVRLENEENVSGNNDDLSKWEKTRRPGTFWTFGTCTGDLSEYSAGIERAFDRWG